MRGRPQRITDDEIVRLVWDSRVRHGACTLGELAAASGLTVSGIRKRVKRLEDGGRLVQSVVYGSLRSSDERLMRELADGRLIEVT